MNGRDPVVSVHSDRCVASGSCTALAPEVFWIGPDGAQVRADAPAGALCSAAVREAAEYCPAAAIVVRAPDR